MAYPKWSLDEVVHLLKDGQGAKSLTDFADELGVSKQYLSNVFNGNCAPSTRLLRNFGYERDDTPQFVKVQKENRKMSTTSIAKIGCAHCSEEFNTDQELLDHASKQHSDKLRRPKKSSNAKQTTLVNVILDKSGSMSTKIADVIGGFNTYIAELKKDDVSDYLFTLTLFDTDFAEKYLAEPLSAIADLDDKSYQPSGGTALNDAVGRTIKLIEGDSRNADKIITVIMTDGEENSSHEYSTDAVKVLIQAKEKAGWAFIFLGASLNAFQQGASYGIAAANVAQYDQGHYRGTFSNMAHATASASSGAAPMNACFSANPDVMLKSANLNIGSDSISGDPFSGSAVSGGSGVTITHTTPPNKPQAWNRGTRKGWNPQRKNK